jgi:hypothetical protein
VAVANNLFSAEYVQEFMGRLQAHRELQPDQGPNVQFSIHDHSQPSIPLSLSDQLASWNEEIFQVTGQSVSLEAFLAMDTDIQTMLTHYLQRLRKIKDYEDGGDAKNNVIARVSCMLKLASENEKFKDAMLALIHEGLGSCGDRVLIVFNDIEILSQFHTPDLGHEAFRDLAIRASRYEQLKLCAEVICTREGLGDEIETILYFQIHLKDALKLPITTQNMLYPGCSGVTSGMLAEAKGKIESLTELELLERSDYWKDRMKEMYSKKTNEIQEYYTDLLEHASQYLDSDNREEYLLQFPKVAEFLNRAQEKGVAVEYTALCNFIAAERSRGLVSPTEALDN